MTQTGDILTKKGLKNFIKENGFFIQIRSPEKISTDEARTHLEKLDDAVKTKVNIPKNAENIQVFRGLASQFYGKGKKSRNGYKYDHKGMDLKNYMKKPLILLQHDSNKPIGFALSLEFKEGVGMEIVYFVDYNTKAAKDNEHEIREGYIGMLSTGAITHEWMVEDAKTGEFMTPSEAIEADVDLWGVICGTNDNYIMVVTKSELVENSQVTIGSNEDAQTKGDSLADFFTNQLEQMEIQKPQKNEAAVKEDETVTAIDQPEGEEPEAAEPETPEESGEPTTDPEQPEGEASEPDTAGNAEEAGAEEAAGNAEDPVAAEGEEDPDAEAGNAEAAEEPEGAEGAEEPVKTEDSLDLVGMTKALAANLLELEDSVSKSKEGFIKADEVDALIQNAVNSAVAEQNKVLEKMAETVVSLSNKVKENNDRLNKVAVNKPRVVHRQLEAAKESKRDSWA